MVGKKDELRVRIDFAYDLAHGPVDLPIKPEEGVTVARGLLRPPVPEEVVDAIGLHDVKLKEIPVFFLVKMKADLDPLLQGQIKIFQKSRLIVSRPPCIGVNPVSHGLESPGQLPGIGHLIDIHAEKTTDQDPVYRPGGISQRNIDDQDPLPLAPQSLPEGLTTHVL